MKRFFLIACTSVFIMTGCDKAKEYSYDHVLYLDAESVALYYGDERQITASPSVERDAVRWTSEDTNVATVSGSGLIKAVGAGETRIFVSLGTYETELPVTVTIPTVNRVTGRPGNKRAALELVITNDRVKTVRITRMDNSQSQETDIDFKSGAITVFYTGLDEGRYSFEVVCLDVYGNESVPVEVPIQVYGDNYQSTLTVRPVRMVTKFGNGYAVGVGVTSGMYSELFYKDKQGTDVVKRVPAQDEAVYLYDYGGSGFSHITYYLPESASVDTFRTAKVEYAGTVVDVSVTVSSSVEHVTINSGNFDLGGEGIGFHDSNTNHDPGGGANYRPNLGDYLSAAMDIEGDGGNIGYTDRGEWLMYTVNVQDEGNYAIDWYISVNGDGAQCHVEVDDVASSVYPMGNNNDWSDWRYYCERNNVEPPVFHLTTGEHKIKFYFNSGNFNYNGLRITYKP
jgi:hypothetical protein